MHRHHIHWEIITLIALVALFSCTQQAQPTPIVMVEQPSAPQKQSIEDFMAQIKQLQDPPEPVVETVPPQPMLSSTPPLQTARSPVALPKSRKEACRQEGLPATYEACLNGCAKRCGDVSSAHCDEIKVGEFSCYACSCE